MDDQYTTKQVADKLKINPSRVRQLAIANNLGKKWGRDWVFSRADVESMRMRDTARGPKPKQQRAQDES